MVHDAYVGRFRGIESHERALDLLTDLNDNKDLLDPGK
jgi:hypothetical protein